MAVMKIFDYILGVILLNEIPFKAILKGILVKNLSWLAYIHYGMNGLIFGLYSPIYLLEGCFAKFDISGILIKRYKSFEESPHGWE